MSVISALEKIKNSYEIELYVDSKYVADGINSWLEKWKKNGWKTSDKKDVLNKDLWQRLDQLLQKHKVKAIWIKGHNGHPENEYCDRVAKEEAEKQKIKMEVLEVKEVIIKVKELFPEISDIDSLVSRESGLEVRLKIEDELKKNTDAVIVLDFQGIELITQGFGDEIIGVLIRRQGLDFVKEKIKVINANGFIRGTLNWVASYSKKMISEENRC